MSWECCCTRMVWGIVSTNHSENQIDSQKNIWRKNVILKTKKSCLYFPYLDDGAWDLGWPSGNNPPGILLASKKPAHGARRIYKESGSCAPCAERTAHERILKSGSLPLGRLIFCSAVISTDEGPLYSIFWASALLKSTQYLSWNKHTSVELELTTPSPYFAEANKILKIFLVKDLFFLKGK